MFPLGAYIGFDRKDNTWFDLLVLDATYLHITAFAACAFLDKVIRQQENMASPETILHFLKGVRLLRERLLFSDEEAKVSDATVSVVLILANCAYSTGELETARRHLEGLHKIVRLRGGVATFRSSFGQKLLMETLRYTASIALQDIVRSNSPQMRYWNRIAQWLRPNLFQRPYFGSICTLS
jgi:Fungal specific transcription factor domain